MDVLPKTGSRLQSNTTMAAARALVKKASASNQPISLAKNEILRALVTDLRPGIVKIRLANKQALVAKLEGHNEVSIGDVAAFKILENDNGKLTLKKLNSTVSAEEATIQKALEEANLPTSPVNHTIVKELLYHKLPINKETINRIIKETENFPDASVETIVYLTKHGIELKEDYLSQFESYKSFDHRLMQHIDRITEELGILLKQAALRADDKAFLAMASALFEFFSIEGIDLPSYLSAVLAEQEQEAMLEEDVAMEDMTELLEEEDPLEELVVKKEFFQTAKDRILSLRGKDGRQLLKLFSSYELPEDYKASLHNGELPLRETIQHLSDAIRQMSTEDPSQIASFKTPLILSLFEEFGELQLTNQELASLLSTNERAQLLEALQDVPLLKEDISQIISGERSIPDFLSLAASFLTDAYTDSIRGLFSKPGFCKLLSAQMQSKFTLTPEDLQNDPNAVDRFYGSLSGQMNELSGLVNGLSGSVDTASLHQRMDDLGQNLDFMEAFNKLFTYVQLPIKLREQITHGDLYVYTNKQKLRSGQKDLSVLLHLDMDHLGPLDIYLSLTGTTIRSKFYGTDKETMKLMQTNVQGLRDALRQKGFSLEPEFLESPKQPDILKDLVDKEQSAASIKRYSFDIRA